MKALARLRGLAGERDWLLTFLSVAGVVGLGVLIGQQYLNPDKRILAFSAALLLFGVTWRLDLVAGLGVLMFALPFPRGTVFGSTNLAFILLLTVIWLLRFTQREAPGPSRTPFDAPIAGLLIAYVLSFYNVIDYEHAFPLANLFIACVLMFYLIVMNVRTGEELRRFHLFQTAATFVIYLFCLWEILMPGHTLIAGWIDLRNTSADLSVAQGTYRIGGPWTDFELLSEFAALNTSFFLFQLFQARSMLHRVIFGGMLLFSMVVQFATVTRGGMIALVIGIAYLMWLTRRRLNIVPLTIVAGLLAVVIGVMTTVLHKFTSTGDLFSRLEGTKFINGMPDTRAEVWPQAWGRMLEHPLIGHGPQYDITHGLVLWYWPHDLPLFIGNCFGFFGLAMFVWLMVTFWRNGSPRTDRLDDPNYAEAFLLCARVQLFTFFVDEIKIEYLRNQTYQFQPWLLFSTIAVAAMIRQRTTAAAAIPTPEAPRARGLASVPARS